MERSQRDLSRGHRWDDPRLCDRDGRGNAWPVGKGALGQAVSPHVVRERLRGDALKRRHLATPPRACAPVPRQDQSRQGEPCEGDRERGHEASRSGARASARSDAQKSVGSEIARSAAIRAKAGRYFQGMLRFGKRQFATAPGVVLSASATARFPPRASKN